MKRTIFKTTDSIAALTIRVFLGGVVFVHGAQKLLGWFGGYGFTGTMDYFTETVGLPWIIAFMVIILESIGAIAMVAGIATRVLAIGYVFLGMGIVFTSHLEHGFFMNWFGNQQGEGYEYFLLWIGMAISLIISGGGAYSIDRIIAPKDK